MSYRSTSVAVIEPVGGHGGMNYYDFGLCEGLSGADNDVTLYTCDETKVPDNLNFKAKTYFKGIYGDAPKSLRAIRYTWGLIKAFIHAKSIGVGIVHLHFFHASYMELLTVKLSCFFGFKIVITSHDVESFSGEHSQKTAKSIYTICDKIIAHNKVSRDELVANLNINPIKISVIPHGNYIDYVNKSETKEDARKKLSLHGEGPFILFFGQIKQVKGLDLLINALPDVVRDFP